MAPARSGRTGAEGYRRRAPGRARPAQGPQLLRPEELVHTSKLVRHRSAQTAGSVEKDTMATKLAYPVAIVLVLLVVAVPSADASLIAPPAVCPSQLDASAPAAAQERAMRCMTDFARARVGLNTLADSPQLDLSSEEKGSDVLRCD